MMLQYPPPCILCVAGAQNFSYVATSTSVHLTWAPPLPPCDNDVAGYKVTYSDQTCGLSGNQSLPQFLNTTDLEYTFRNLERGREYTFRLATIGKYGGETHTSLTVSPPSISKKKMLITGVAMQPCCVYNTSESLTLRNPLRSTWHYAQVLILLTYSMHSMFNNKLDMNTADIPLELHIPRVQVL